MTSYLSGQAFFVLTAGVLVATAVAWGVAILYRRRMVALMRGGPAPDAARAGVVEAATAPPRAPARFDAAASQRARRRLLGVLTGLCLLVALSQAWFALEVEFQAFSFSRLLLVGAIYAWPVVLAWGLVLRWSWPRIFAGVVFYAALMVVLVMLRSNEQQSLPGVVWWMFSEVAVPLTILLIVSAHGRIRAIAPYLLPVALLMAAASVAATEILAADVNAGGRLALPLVAVFGADGTLLLVVLAPWLLLAWPAYALARWLAAGYRRKRFSDLGYLFGTYWLVILAVAAAPAISGAGPAGFGMLLPWLWLPLAGGLLARWQTPVEAPPSLLVLRVFHRDAQVEHLFDQVIERWRFTGNTMLIAGTDLVSRTIDPDDLFMFLSRRLATRFVNTPDDVPARIADFDLTPDPDGRYRVNECYCRDSTWELALAALVARCDVVLMDLRGFQPHNQGCRHELGVLAQAANLRRVIVLHDRSTDRQTADGDIGAAPPGRFLWLDAGRLDGAKAHETFAALFPDSPVSA